MVDSEVSQNDGTISYDTRCEVCLKQEDRPCYIGYHESRDIFSCDEHFHDLHYKYVKRKRFSNINIGQVVDSWENATNHKRMKMTHGKAWEIEHRTLAEDGKTVINAKTGKPTEY